jgi:hypothetical protein
MKIEYKCNNEECNHEFKVDFLDADDDTPAEIWPEECPKCNHEVDFEEITNDAEPDRDAYVEYED